MNGYKSGSRLETTEMAKRFPIKLPVWHEKYLLWWAAMKGTSKTALAQNTIQARIEANKDQILEMLGDRAKDLGCTVEELQEQILKEAKFNPSESEVEADE
jgi:hypothetical protein